MKVERCPQCGSKIIRYKHVLNKSLVDALNILARIGKPANIAQINLTHNQICNFAKLRYWGLVRKENENGAWAVTMRGYGFLAGYESLPRYVISYRGQTFGYDGELVCALDFFDEKYWKRPDYIKNSIIAREEGPRLFK